jgi:hypothetical protein
VSKLEFPAPTARNVIAQGDALGEVRNCLQALKARNSDPVAEMIPIARLQRWNPGWPTPGPMAQAITFRAVGAGSLEF